MKSENKLEEYHQKRRRQESWMRSFRDYLMGGAILLAGLFFMFRTKLGIASVNERFGETDSAEKFFGGICIAYGIWRIYRGFKKNYWI
ncbi:MAG: hypothetical protein N2747_03175 [Chitinophagaceae bacterium]|nr:hypothetical protein [Chitinophagaceae bacterium]